MRITVAICKLDPLITAAPKKFKREFFAIKDCLNTVDSIIVANGNIDNPIAQALNTQGTEIAVSN